MDSYHQNLPFVSLIRSLLHQLPPLSFDFPDYEPSASSIPAKLLFSNDVASPVFTKDTITGRRGGSDGNESIKVTLVDSIRGETITTGSLASAKVKIVLLRGDCSNTTTGKEFEKNTVVKWGKKKNLLLGDCYVDLTHGCGTVGKIRIKHDRNPLKNASFRLGAMVVGCGPNQVKEAVTKPFQVKDNRIAPKLSGPLKLEHEVWRLKNIAQKGKIHKRLKNKNILTVKTFLCKHSTNARELQEICGLKGKKWEMAVNHAKTSLTENVNNGSTSQETNTLPSYDQETDSIGFDYENCYKPQFCPETDTMIIDGDFSIDAYYDSLSEPFQVYQGGVDGALEGGTSIKVKKRWMKLRMFGFFIASLIMKKVGSCMPAVWM